MNIEESVEYLKNCLNDEYNFKNATRKKDKEAIETLLTAYEKEKEKNKDMSCDLTETRADNIDESTMLKQIKLKLQEKNIPIETLLGEFERLEDLEDDLTTVYLNGVYDGEKKVEYKIKAKIEEVDYKMIAHQDVREAVKQVLQSLLEKE